MRCRRGRILGLLTALSLVTLALSAAQPTPALAQVKAATTTTLTTSAASVTAGQAVTFTAQVTSASPGTPTPGGTVTFRDGTTVLGVVPLNAFGQTMLTTNALVSGVHKITAVYGGDVNNNA